MAAAAGQARRPRLIAAALLTTALALATAGCGSSSAPAANTAATTHHPMTHSHHPMSHPMAETATFGPDCGMVPASGMGSFHSMSMDPVVTAASHSPLMSTFAADVKTAGLTGEFDSMHAITVFVPENSAFHMMPASQMHMMHGSMELARTLKYLVVNGHITPMDLAHGMSLKTLEGGSLTTSLMGKTYEVNNADVICGNIQNANATVYVINKVLEPMH